MVVAGSGDGGASWSEAGRRQELLGHDQDIEDKNFYAVDNTSASSAYYGRQYTCWDRGNDEQFGLFLEQRRDSWTEVDLPTAPSGGTRHRLRARGAEERHSPRGLRHPDLRRLDLLRTSGCSTPARPTVASAGRRRVHVKDFNLVSFSEANSVPQAQDEPRHQPVRRRSTSTTRAATCDGYPVRDLQRLHLGFGGRQLRRLGHGDRPTVARPGTRRCKVNDDGARRAYRSSTRSWSGRPGRTGTSWSAGTTPGTTRPNREVELLRRALARTAGVSFEANIKASQASERVQQQPASRTTDENATDNAERQPEPVRRVAWVSTWPNGKALHGLDRQRATSIPGIVVRTRRRRTSASP